MVLSNEAVLVYILADSGVRGHLTAGRIERNPSGSLTVFNTRGECFEYLCGKRIRSWCVMAPGGKLIDGWREILPKDLSKILE
jgi:hypothetical protein